MSIKKLAYTFVVIFDMWLVISYIDIVSHNMTDNQYQSWNAFTIFADLVENNC